MKLRPILKTTGFGLAVGIAAVSSGITVNLTASKDNTLYESSTGALSNGAGPSFFVGKTGTNLIRRGLIAFDIAASIPTGATINSATLSLNMSQTVAGPETISLRRALQDWGEGTSNAGASGGGGAAATAGDATWVHTFFSGSLWTSVGGTFSATSSASTSVAGVGVYTWSSAQLRDDVQDMLDNPSSSFGWGITGNETAISTAKRFESSESLNPAFVPVLRVEYTAVPEPATLLICLVGLAPLARRRPR